MKNGSLENIVCDSGCSFPVVSEKIVSRLGIKIRPFSSNFKIVDASGNSLQLRGTAVLYITTQVLGRRVETVEVADLSNNDVDTELLLSLGILLKWDLLPPLFPNQTVTDHVNSILAKMKYNKARNSHKPRLGEYVQQGNIRSITYIIRGGGSFSSFIQSIVSKKLLKKLVFKYSGSKGVEKNYFISS